MHFNALLRQLSTIWDFPANFVPCLPKKVQCVSTAMAVHDTPLSNRKISYYQSMVEHLIHWVKSNIPLDTL